MRRRFSYANVTSTLALVAALTTGVAYASPSINFSSIGGQISPFQILGNSIGSSQIKNDSLQSDDLKNQAIVAHDIKPSSLLGDLFVPKTLTAKSLKPGTLTGQQVAANSLTGSDIVGSTLKNVNAASVDGKSLNCAAGTKFYVWGCWETSPNAAVNWTGAIVGCGNKGGVLPSAAELGAFAEEPGINITAPNAEWTTEITGNPITNNAESMKFYEPTTIDYAPFAESHPYRCVLPIIG